MKTEEDEEFERIHRESLYKLLHGKPEQPPPDAFEAWWDTLTYKEQIVIGKNNALFVWKAATKEKP